MKRAVLAAALLLSVRTTALAAAAAPAAAPDAPATFCAEWVRQSREGFERLTLFADGELVWKRSRDGRDEISRKRIEPEERKFYCEYFARPELSALPPDLRSGVTGSLVRQSRVVLPRADGQTRELRFDDLSALTAEASSLRSSLEGLRNLLTSPLAPASRFAAEKLSPGMLLKRFDGVVFRVRKVDAEKGIVELEGVREPYSEFRKLEELRFLFAAPE